MVIVACRPRPGRDADGCLAEAFEWTWGRFAEVRDEETLASLPKAQRRFSPFDPVAL